MFKTIFTKLKKKKILKFKSSNVYKQFKTLNYLHPYSQLLILISKLQCQTSIQKQSNKFHSFTNIKTLLFIYFFLVFLMSWKNVWYLTIRNNNICTEPPKNSQENRYKYKNKPLFEPKYCPTKKLTNIVVKIAFARFRICNHQVKNIINFFSQKHCCFFFLNHQNNVLKKLK